MGYQFIHIEAYARVGSTAKKGERKRSAQEIVSEAERAVGHYEGHVHSPETPIILPGFVAPSTALAEAEEAAEKAPKDAMGRRLRKDAPIILAGVVSCPPDMKDRWEKIKEDSLQFLRQKWGNRLRSVVEHRDESTPHLHFYVVPRAGERALDLHPGHAAKNAAGSRKEVRVKVQNASYREGVKQFQDEYFRSVGMFNGLQRVGPKRRRLSRAGWQAEKAATCARLEEMDLHAEIAEKARLQRLAKVEKLPLAPPVDGGEAKQPAPSMARSGSLENLLGARQADQKPSRSAALTQAIAEGATATPRKP